MTRRVALFLRTHDWGPFARDAATRAAARAVGADVFILADETRSGPIDAAPFARIGHTEADFPALGLPAIHHPSAVMLWWNCDYGILDGILKQPDYDWYLVVEDDVAINLDLMGLVDTLAAQGIDAVVSHRPNEIAGWSFAATMADSDYARLVWAPMMVVILRHAAAVFLVAERRRLAARHAAGEMAAWPFSDGFLPSALLHGGFVVRPLGDYVDTSRFSASLIHLASDPAVRAPGAAFHSVLDLEHFWGKLVSRHYDWMLEQARYDDLRGVRAGLLASGQTSYRGWRVRGPVRLNLALDQPARQSSRCGYSRRLLTDAADPIAVDAAGAVTGFLTGGRQGFHTDHEPAPWWTVDLGSDRPVAEVWVYNRCHEPDRARAFSVWVAGDGQEWVRAYAKTDGRVFTGNDDPQVCRFDQTIAARHVRIQLDLPGYLHLDEVEVFGPLPAYQAS